MPELPEAETILRGLKQRVLGRRIASIEVISPLVLKSPPDEFTEGAGGRWIKGVARKGKALAIELSGQDHALPRYLLLRLGMTGQLTVVPRESPLEPRKHLCGRSALRGANPPAHSGRTTLTRQGPPLAPHDQKSPRARNPPSGHKLSRLY